MLYTWSGSFQARSIHPLARLEGGDLAVSTGTGGLLWGFLAAVVTGVLDADLLDRGCAVGGANGGDVAVVGVDAGEDLAGASLDVLHGDGARGAVALAVAA